MIKTGKSGGVKKSTLDALADRVEVLLNEREPKCKMSVEEVERKLKELERDDYHIPLKEHRCSCGRLLGRFNGQAEVKCPKCGKMNVIGVEKQCKS